MNSFWAGLWPALAVAGQAAADDVHGLPLISSWTAWMFGGFWTFGRFGACPVRVHTSWVAISCRCADVVPTAAPPRSTVAVDPSTITLLSLVRGGNAVT